MATFIRAVLMASVSAITVTPCLASAGTINTVAQAEPTRVDAAEAGAGEIVVTAQKRSQSINDVGIAVTAIGSATLERQNISTLSDIVQSVPGLTFAVSNNNTPIVTMRGIGFYENSLAAYPANSVYLDEVPLPFPVLSTLTAFDLERVEILKGPQGTLFGQNSTGGAVNLIAAKPTSYFSAGASVSFGRFDTFESTAFVSGPLSPDLNARIAGRFVDSGPWQKSYTRSDKIGEMSSYAARLLLDWEPTETLRLSVNLNGWKDKSDPIAPQFVRSIPQVPVGVLPEIANYPIAPDKARAADWSPSVRPMANNDLYQGVLRADWDIGDWATLTSITSYVNYDKREAIDGDGLSFSTGDTSLDEGFIESFNQEIRLAGDIPGDIKWIVGANFEGSHVYENINIVFQDSSFSQVAPVFAGGYSADQHMRNYAVFGNVEVPVTSAVTIKGGARYTKANRRSVNCSYDSGDGFTNAFFTILARQLSGTNLPELQLGQCFTLLEDFSNGPAFSHKLKEDNLSWRVGLDYRPSSDLLLYANIARGYKAGSIPIANASSYTQYLPVVQESVLSYEAGIKKQLFDRKLSLDAALFYYDYTDKQLRSGFVDPVFGVLQALVNIPKSHVQGAELQVAATPMRGLSITASGTYTDAKVDRFTGLNPAGVLGNFAGARVQFTPRFQGALNIDYQWETGSVSPFVGAGIHAQSGDYSILGGERYYLGGVRPYAIPGYALVDLRAGISAADKSWTAMLFAKNVTNQFYYQNVTTFGDTIIRYAGKPVTYGITLSTRF